MPPRTRIRRRQSEGDGMGNDPSSRAIRHQVKNADTNLTCGLMVIVITGDGDRPGEVATATHAGFINRDAPSLTAETSGLLQGKMAFVYESDAEPGRPGWVTSMDRELCLHTALGDSLFPPGQPKELQLLLADALPDECRWVSTAERAQRQPGLW